MSRYMMIFAGTLAWLLAAPAHAQERSANSHTADKGHNALKVAPTKADKTMQRPATNQRPAARPAPANDRAISTPEHPHLDAASNQRPEQPYINKTGSRGAASSEIAHGTTADTRKVVPVGNEDIRISANDDWELPTKDPRMTQKRNGGG